MPSFSYTVINNLPPVPFSSSNPILAPAPGVSACFPKFKTQQDFLDLFDRIVPPDYIEPLKSPGPGYEIYQMFGATYERCSLAAGRAECQVYITLAHGPNKARGEVEFFRETDANGAFTLLAGTIVRDSEQQREFRLLENLEFGATDLKKVAVVEAVQPGFQYNLNGIKVDANGDEIEGQIDEVNLPLQDPPYAEPNIEVRQATDTVGGQPGSLDQLGADRSINRSPNETDEEYRVRVRTLPDTISPAAIRRQLDAFFLPTGIPYEFIEVFENQWQSCWNAPAGAIINPIVGNYDPNLFVYNDPRDIAGNRWLDASSAAGGFVIRIPNFTIDDVGFPYDAADVSEVFGIPAYDVTLADAGAYDGEDLGVSSLLLQLVDLLRKIKAAGIAAIIELEGQ